MSIQFPDIPEISLKRPPLSEVICQVKFPLSLRIAKDMPVEFQEAVRARFPVLAVEHGVVLRSESSLVTDGPLIEKAPKLYRFKSQNSSSMITLAPDFFALSTNEYSHWQDFQQDFRFAEGKVREIFHPTLTTRVGLRFVNQITGKNSGCKSLAEFLNLFRAELTCLIRSDAWSEPEETITRLVLPDGRARLALRFGFSREGKHPVFLLDFDYFDEQTYEFKGLDKRIERYHAEIYRAFRWCLKDAALARFEPLQQEA